jgi:hypothetical protein
LRQVRYPPSGKTTDDSHSPFTDDQSVTIERVGCDPIRPPNVLSLPQNWYPMTGLNRRPEIW